MADIICPNGHPLDTSVLSDSATVVCPECGEAAVSGANLDALPPPPGRNPPRPSPVSSDRRVVSAEAFLHHAEASDGELAASIDDFLSEHAEIREIDDAKALANELVNAGVLTEFQATVLLSVAPEPLRLGSFQILDVIGRGGMGVVYRARHDRIEREVALKVLPPQFSSDTDAVERFEREANAAAQLQHDNIVTVFEVGTDKGRHFFAMQLVAGQSLSQRLQDGPLENVEAARLLQTVSRAVAHAHDHGILHRDLKPANILIDADGDRPLVADFGLAKLSRQNDELTYSGVMMGTPQYMSPEQARDAARSTAKADVYSLGATLYHALTGRPPFQASSAIETVRQVLDSIPAAPRVLNSSVSPDLNTICLKCLEKEPAARFNSAAQLADELQRVVEGRPILSRPLSSTQQVWRWCRRNPFVALLSAAFVATLASALVATSVGYYEVSVARDQAETELRTAVSVVDDLLIAVSEESLLNHPGSQPLKKDLLEKALAYLQGFIDRRGNDPAIQEQLAGVWYSVAVIQQQIQDPKASLSSLRNARHIYRRLQEGHPENRQFRQALGETWNVEGQVFRAMADFELARTAFDEALQIRQQLAEMDATTEEQRQYANTMMNLALLKKDAALQQGIHEADALAAVQEALEEAQQIRRALLRDEPDNVSLLRDVAIGQFSLAGFLHETTDPTRSADTVVRAFRDSVAAFRELRSAAPAVLADRYTEAVSWRLLADILEEDKESLEAYQRAEKLSHDLTCRNPDVVEWRLEYARTLTNFGWRLASVAEDRNALGRLRTAIAELRDLQQLESRSVEIGRELGLALQLIGLVHDQLGDTERAVECLRESVKILTRCAAQSESDMHLRHTLEESQAALDDIAGSINEAILDESADSGTDGAENNSAAEESR